MSYLLDSWSCPLDTAWPEQLNTISLCLFLFIRINTHVLVTFFSCRAFFSRVTSGSSAFVNSIIFLGPRGPHTSTNKNSFFFSSIFFFPPVSSESGFWTIEKWKVKKNIFHFSQEMQSEIKMPFTLLRSPSERKITGNWDREVKVKWKKLRDRVREVIFLENFRKFKKDRFWSMGKGALPSTNG